MDQEEVISRKHDSEETFIKELLGLLSLKTPDPVSALTLMIGNSINVFAKRAKRYESWYYIMKMISFITPLIITTITTLEFDNSKYYIALLSLLTSLAVGIAGIGMFHDNWIRNRYYCEQLKQEVMQFASDTGDYDGKKIEQKIDLLGAKTLLLLKSENMEWKETAQHEYAAASAEAKKAIEKQENDHPDSN